MKENRVDSFLHLIRKSQQGKLKIYLGYCAGVGKTYQMLQEAHRLKAEGVDVVVGYAETHSRKETEMLVSGLEILPRIKLTYRGIEIEEMDLNAIIARRPEIVLVDELAHTNPPGSKHSKRYQDVEEILSKGIHVISTLNVQHLESLYHTVEKATGIKVKERLPDRVIAEADQIVNIDLTTEDLCKRLKEGKIYSSDRIETALSHFFKPSNLDQLRELTLRELAAHLDLRHRDEPEEDPSPSSPEQLMVCLSSKRPDGEMLLRYASRLAGRLNKNWYAVYVQTASEKPAVIDAKKHRFLTNTLALAQQLGATVFTYKGEDIAGTLLQFAKEYRVGHLIVGRSRKITILQKLFGKTSVIERLIQYSQGMAITILDTDSSDEPIESVVATPLAAATVPMHLEKTEESSLSLFQKENFLIWKEPISKTDAYRQLIKHCSSQLTDISEETVIKAIFDREEQGSTFFGNNLAISHARIEELKRPLVGIGIGEKGIIETSSGTKAQIVFLLLSPKFPEDLHLKLLAQLGRLSQNEPLLSTLLTADTHEDAHAILKNGVEPAKSTQSERREKRPSKK